jgi:FkbM family methyltransferase
LFPDAVVHAFEPLPVNFAKLAERAAANPAIQPHELALSDKTGTAVFHVAEWADASSLLAPKDTGSTFDAYQASIGKINVQTDTLDDIARKYNISHIDILKIDAQGAELAILHGSTEMLASGRIKLIYTEAQFRPLYEGAGTLEQITTYLISNGFIIHNLFNINHNQRGEICWCDALFVHGGA